MCIISFTSTNAKNIFYPVYINHVEHYKDNVLVVEKRLARLQKLSYYGLQVIVEENIYRGITNIGKKPTVNQTDAVSVETYLYDFKGNMYGQEITVELLHFKRPEYKFAGIEELKKQMEEDIAAGRRYHAENALY